jgi:hypothetical protein
MVSGSLSLSRYVILYPRNSPKIVSDGGGFHDTYIEFADVLCAIVVTGFPTGTENQMKIKK